MLDGGCCRISLTNQPPPNPGDDHHCSSAHLLDLLDLTWRDLNWLDKYFVENVPVILLQHASRLFYSIHHHVLHLPSVPWPGLDNIFPVVFYGPVLLWAALLYASPDCSSSACAASLPCPDFVYLCLVDLPSLRSRSPHLPVNSIQWRVQRFTSTLLCSSWFLKFNFNTYIKFEC